MQNMQRDAESYTLESNLVLRPTPGPIRLAFHIAYITIAEKYIKILSNQLSFYYLCYIFEHTFVLLVVLPPNFSTELDKAHGVNIELFRLHLLINVIMHH